MKKQVIDPHAKVAELEAEINRLKGQMTAMNALFACAILNADDSTVAIPQEHLDQFPQGYVLSRVEDEVAGTIVFKVREAVTE